MSGKSKLKIGFDFDGVLVYNPLRVGRLPVSWVKRKLFKPKKLKFWHPKKPYEKAFWKLAHKTSIFPAVGYKRLLTMLKKSQIKGYVITGRFSFLKDDFEGWLEKYDPEKLFAGYFLNEKNEQPHLFKERMIRELKLDYFVEDNWDIVKYLSERLNISSSKLKAQNSKQISRPEDDQPLAENSKFQIQNRSGKKTPITHYPLPITKIHWIYNILDRNIDYPNKHPYLGKFLNSIVQLPDCSIVK
jgi:hypothetical protein